MAAGMTLWGVHLVVVRVAGPIVPGTIIERYTDINNDRKTIYFLRCRYSLNDQTYTRNELVSLNTYNRVSTGADARVQVSPILPGKDSLILLPGKSPWEDVIILLLGSVVLNGLMGVTVWHVVVVPWRRKQLVIKGTPISGRLVNKVLVTSSRMTYYQLLYEFQPPGHEDTVSGKQYVREDDWKAVKIGKAVTVLYDPDNVKNSVLYRYADFEVL